MRVKTFELFAQEEDHVSWLVDGLIPDTGWFLFVGEQGIGKSTFVTQMCASLMDGRPFLGMDTKQTKPLYIQADSPSKEWREALRRIAPTSKALTVVDVPSQCLDNETHVRSLKSIIERYEPGIIVFDSLYNLTGVAINTERVLEPIRIMKDLCQGKPFILIHHPNKDKQGGVQGHSGHNSLSANCSIHFMLTKNRLKVEKGRLLDKKTMSFGRDKHGLWIIEEEDRYEDMPWMRSTI
jgi:RecA-family ATPase